MNARAVRPAVFALLTLSACHVGVSPMASAARRGDIAAIERLLAEGADPHEGSGVRGWPPLLHALHKGQGQEGAALRLMRESMGPSRELDAALVMAAGYAQTAMVQALLARGANPRTGVDGSDALAEAVRGASDIDYRYKGCAEHTATVRALLAAAPDLELTGGAGSSAREAAEHYGCSEMLAILR